MKQGNTPCKCTLLNPRHPTVTAAHPAHNMGCKAASHKQVGKSTCLLLDMLCRHTHSKAAGAAVDSNALQVQPVPTQQILQQTVEDAMERPHSRRLSRDVSGRQQQRQQQHHEEVQLVPQQAPPCPPVRSSGGAQSSTHLSAAVELPRPTSSGSSRIMSAKRPPPALASPGTVRWGGHSSAVQNGYLHLSTES
jgi:hypothetical protein